MKVHLSESESDRVRVRVRVRVSVRVRVTREIRNEGTVQERRLMSPSGDPEMRLTKAVCVMSNTAHLLKARIGSGGSTDDKHLIKIRAPMITRGNPKSARVPSTPKSSLATSPCVCDRGVAVLQICRMTGVATHECRSQSGAEGFNSQAATGTPRLTQNLGQASDVQMANVQCDDEVPCERVAHQVTLPEMPVALFAAGAEPIDVETGQLLPFDMVTPRCGPLVQEVNKGAKKNETVVTWTDEQLLEMATSLPARQMIRHQSRGLPQPTGQTSGS